MAARRRVRDEEYERLLERRTGLRTFLKWSEDQAAMAGLPPSQHQLLLAIRGHPYRDAGPAIGDVARYLLVKPHTAGEQPRGIERALPAGAAQRDRLVEVDDLRLVGRLDRRVLAPLDRGRVRQLLDPGIR